MRIRILVVLLAVNGLAPVASGADLKSLERRVRDEVSRFAGTMGVVARNLDLSPDQRVSLLQLDPKAQHKRLGWDHQLAPTVA